MLIGKIFTIIVATLILTGWLLSIFGQLNAIGYAVALPICILIFIISKTTKQKFCLLFLKKLIFRFSKPTPALFLVLSSLCLIGGLSHDPTNYDFLTYRISRLLHWHHLSAWAWLDTANSRMNFSGTNSEWIMSPLLLLMNSDRLFFLSSFISYSLLPSAIFIVFRGMGISNRATWWAMWIIPSAYCFVSQAGSTGNDLLGASFFMISIAFLFRAKKTREFGWAGLSVLAISIFSGIKASNLPLGLVWIVTAWPTLSIFLASWKRSALVAILAIFSSFIPMATLNMLHAGNWKGIGTDEKAVVAGSPLGGLTGNIILTAAGCIQPPVLRAPAQINQFLNESLPESLVNLLNRDFPRFVLKMVELPNEEGAGLGIGVAGILALGLFSIPFFKTRSQRTYFNRLGLCILIANFMALAAYMVLMASESAARLLSPYYFIALAIPFAILGNSYLLKTKVWKTGSFFAMASSLIIPLATPSRPILPIAQLAENFLPQSNFANRITEVYSVYANRSDNLAPLRNLLPEDAKRIGFISSGDDSEVSLWKPYSSKRSVVHIIPGRPFPEDLDALVVSKHGLQIFFDGDLSQIVEFDDYYKLGWNKIGTKMITSKVQEGPIEWLIFSKDSNRDDSLD